MTGEISDLELTYSTHTRTPTGSKPGQSQGPSCRLRVGGGLSGRSFLRVECSLGDGRSGRQICCMRTWLSNRKYQHWRLGDQGWSTGALWWLWPSVQRLRA
jgi:hypothetical protein